MKDTSPLVEKNSSELILFDDSHSIEYLSELHLALENFLKNSEEAVFVLDNLNKIIFCSKRAYHLFAFPFSPEGMSIQRALSELLDIDSSNGDVAIFCKMCEEKHRAMPQNLHFMINGNLISCYCYVHTILFLGKPYTLASVKPVAKGDILDKQQLLANESSLVVQNRYVEENRALRLESAKRKIIVQSLRRSEWRYRAIFDNALEGIAQWTRDGRLFWANMAFARMFGFSNVNALLEYFSGKEFHLFSTDATLREMLDTLEQNKHTSSVEFEAELLDGEKVWLNVNAHFIYDSFGSYSYFEGFFSNISERKQVEDRLFHQAFYDPLTGLANRSLFTDRLSMLLRRSLRNKNEHFTVCFLDLDKFKQVNDLYGHKTGDFVLQHVASVFMENVRESDTVSRFGGDEFGIILEGLVDQDIILAIARRIHARLSTPFVVNNAEIHIGVSIGVVLQAEQYSSIDIILSHADAAMYQAKLAKDGYVQVYNDTRGAGHAKASISFEEDLESLLEIDSFFFTYRAIQQPESKAAELFFTVKAYGKSGDDTVVLSSLSSKIRKYALDKYFYVHLFNLVCKEVAAWKKNSTKSFILQVPIPGLQLLIPQIYENIKEILLRHKLSGENFCFLLNGLGVTELNQVRAKHLNPYIDLGFRFSFNCTKTPTTAAGYLLSLPLSWVQYKKDVFLSHHTSARDLLAMSALIAFGERLGIGSIVTSINTAEEYEKLKGLGGKYFQGDYLSKAQLSSEISTYFA